MTGIALIVGLGKMEKGALALVLMVVVVTVAALVLVRSKR